MLRYDRFFVLTGGPGSGKTTLVDALKALGYATTAEAGRGVIREQMESGGDACPGSTATTDRSAACSPLTCWNAAPIGSPCSCANACSRGTT